MLISLFLFLTTAWAVPCAFDLTPQPWSSLPEIADHRLPERFLQALAKHPLTRAGAERFGRGERLTFDFSLTNHDRRNGWGIQAHFLRLLLAAWFPRAEFADAPSEGRFLVQILIVDSRLYGRDEDQHIEMDHLKLANPSFDLPPRDALRSRMGLPDTARIASFYASRTRPNDIPMIYTALIEQDLADLVIVSMQSLDMDETIELADENGLPIATATAWLGQPRRPSRAIILNDTRGRMPYVHAAADYAVVLGAANGAEPLQQGRPTYVSRQSLTKGPQNRWDTYVRDLTEVGGAHAFDTLPELTDLIRRTAHASSAKPLFADERILGRVLKQTLGLIQDFETLARGR